MLVAGQVDHPGHRPVLVPDPGRAPDVLVHAEGPHPGQPGRGGDPGGRFGLDRVPAGVPVHLEMTGQRGHGGVIVGQRVGGPPDRPAGQLRSRPDQLMLLAERARSQAGSAHRKTRLRQRSTVETPKHGASATWRP